MTTKLTIFTPTYNRAYIIGQLYESLKKQTSFNFEWLVVDDGSVDETEQLFQKWTTEETRFPIRYYKKNNGGKCRAINYALDLAQGELFFTVDSDDQLTSDAATLIEFWEKDLPKDGTYCGFAGSDGDLQGVATNPLFPEPWKDATFFDRAPESEHFIGYDRPWVFYTKIHRQYKYPDISGETFITEAVTWNRMAHDGYKIRCFNNVIYLWEHQETGYTNNIRNIFLNNPIGYALWQKELMEFCHYNFYEKMKTYYSFYCEFNSKLTCRQLSSYIGAPLGIMILMKIFSKFKHR